RDSHILDRVARDRALGQHLSGAFLDGRYVLAGNRASDHLVRELESRAARQRLDAQEDLAELARAAGLLLVAMVPLGAARHRLAIRDLRRTGLELEPELVLDALENEPQVQLSHAAQHGLVRLRVVLDDEARILRRDLVERVRQLLLLPGLRRLEREAVHRRRQPDRHEAHLVLVVARVQHVVEVDLIDLRDGAELAGDRARNLPELLALHAIKMRDLHGLAPVADEDLITGADAALVDAE